MISYQGVQNLMEYIGIHIFHFQECIVSFTEALSFTSIYLHILSIVTASFSFLLIKKNRAFFIRYNETDNKSIIPWICSILNLYLPDNIGQIQMMTAQVIYRYPIVGKIIFRQSKNDPQMDTTIIIENLIHADGNALNNSELHRYISKYIL